MSPENKSSIREVVDLFDKAEKKVKEIEQLDQELSVPSINELRYVGYHLARAMCEDDGAELNAQIHKAKGHCQRAIYDAHEIGIIHLLERLAAFKERYSESAHVIVELVPTYIDDLKKADEASSLLSTVSSNGVAREEYYEECQPHYECLREIVGKLSYAAPLIDQKIDSNNRASIRDTRRFITTTVLTLLAISVSILGIILVG